MRILSPIDNFDHVFDTFFQPTFTTANYQPEWNLEETEDHFLASFDMPGVRREDLKIEVKGNHLYVSGERRRDDRTYGRFDRSFILPNSVATDKIEAHYENGVLNLALPKAEAAKGRTIQIQTGQEGFFSKLLGSKKDKDASAV